MPIRIANAAGFWGDNLDAPRITVRKAWEAGTPVDYLTLEYLAELTMSILARQRQKDPHAGYATDFINALTSVLTVIDAPLKMKIITNAGGVNPLACAREASRLLNDAKLHDVKIGVVSGDDLLDKIDNILDDGWEMRNFDTGEPLADLQRRLVKAKQKIVAANAYLGAQGIVDCLNAGAQIVITGRVADASLTVGPAMYEFGWSDRDWPKLAAASVAGHLIECGAQATGGLYRDWQNLNLADVGYPIAELESDGSCVITKPPGTGGAVTTATVAEQLVYEIGNPHAYFTPDMIVDFTTVELEQVGPDRVAVRGASGCPPHDTYKVSLAYEAGYAAAGQLLVYGVDCVAKARACAEMIRKRVTDVGPGFTAYHVECLGAGESVPGLHEPPQGLREVMLRITAQAQERAALDRLAREFAPLITSGPPGIAGYASMKPEVRPMFAYWPALVPKRYVQLQVEVKSASEWLKEI